MSALVEPDAVVASARHRGARARIGYAEAFAPTRMGVVLAPVAPRPAAGLPSVYRPTPAGAPAHAGR